MIKGTGGLCFFCTKSKEHEIARERARERDRETERERERDRKERERERKESERERERPLTPTVTKVFCCTFWSPLPLQVYSGKCFTKHWRFTKTGPL